MYRFLLNNEVSLYATRWAVADLHGRRYLCAAEVIGDAMAIKTFRSITGKSSYQKNLARIYDNNLPPADSPNTVSMALLQRKDAHRTAIRPLEMDGRKYYQMLAWQPRNYGDFFPMSMTPDAPLHTLAGVLHKQMEADPQYDLISLRELAGQVWWQLEQDGAIAPLQYYNMIGAYVSVDSSRVQEIVCDIIRDIDWESQVRWTLTQEATV